MAHIAFTAICGSRRAHKFVSKGAITIFEKTSRRLLEMIGGHCTRRLLPNKHKFIYLPSFFLTSIPLLSTISLFSALFLIGTNDFEWRVATSFYFSQVAKDPRMGNRIAENEFVFATSASELRFRMVITLAIVGPADVQDEWDMKLELFSGKWALPRYVFPISHPPHYILSWCFQCYY